MGGFITAVLLKLFDIKEWKLIFACGLSLPGAIVVVYLFTDIVNLIQHGADAVGILTVLWILALWLIVNLPMTILGGAFGYSNQKIEFPRKVAKIAREIPAQRLEHSPPFITIVPGLFPFVVILLELNFIFDSVWKSLVYSAFAFMWMTFLIWILCSSLVTVVATYLQLAYEEHRWWWRSFLIPSGCGVWPFCYVVYYWLYRVSVATWSGSIIYCCYMSLFVGVYVLAAGSIGFLASLFFTRYIYGVIRVE